MSSFIVIEGLIGVGKTSLCRLLHRELKARLVLEPAKDNPFLANFYADRDRYAFPAQMFYLATRFAQYSDLMQTKLFSDLVVADYLFEKDQLFARHTLIDHELALYQRFADLLGDKVPCPDFILFLDAPTEVIQERIARRAIDAEQVIEPGYLDTLRERYFELWTEWEGCPIYVLDTSSIDYVDSVSDQQWMLEVIRGWLDGKPLAGAPQPFRKVVVEQLGLFGQVG
ncbi:MAG: deoxynucleoside kinase [Myxococcota bacterium]|nr:deoxynucleoside kinase [Myxococcota bacterium]